MRRETFPLSRQTRKDVGVGRDRPQPLLCTTLEPVRCGGSTHTCLCVSATSAPAFFSIFHSITA